MAVASFAFVFRYLNNNKIGVLELGALDHLGSTLQVLRLSRNRISQVPVRAFQLPRLTVLYVPPDSIHPQICSWKGLCIGLRARLAAMWLLLSAISAGRGLSGLG